MTGPLCGKQHPDKPSIQCDRRFGHGGVHWNGPGHALQWGGKMPRHTPLVVKPLPAGKKLAPYRPPAAPPAEKFADIPGQWAFDFGSDDPEALVPPP